MLVSEIVTRVRAVIDELMQNDSNFLRESEDEKNLTSVIIDKIGYALQYVIENAPLEKLDSDMIETLASTPVTGSFSIDASTLVGTLVLPTDMLRIVEARLSSWSHFPIPESDTSQAYLMQQDEYARGSWDRPVNILTYNASGGKVLEMYCAETASDTLVFGFVRKPDTSNIDSSHMSTDVTVPSQLEASLIYQIAGLTMTAFKDELAGPLFAIAARYLDPEGVKSEE